MVGCRGGVYTFCKQKKREYDCRHIEQRHDLHEIVIYELSGKQLRIVAKHKGNASGNERRHSIALKLRHSELRV